MGESVLSRAIAESESLTPFESNISTEELDSVVNGISLEGEKTTSSLPEKADYASLSPSDSALLDTPLTAPVATFKKEDNPFPPRLFQSTKKCTHRYRLLRVLSLLRQLLLCLKVIFWSTGYITSRCQLLTVWLWPNQWFLHHPWFLPTEAPALSTSNSIAPTESDIESIVVIESSEAPESKAEGAAGAVPSVAGTQTGSCSLPPFQWQVRSLR